MPSGAAAVSTTVDPRDPLALRVAARSGRRSVGRFGALVRTSLALVWASGRGVLLALVTAQLLAAVALAGQVLAVQRVLVVVLDAPRDRLVDEVLVPVVVLAALSALAAVAGSVQGQLQRLLGES